MIVANFIFLKTAKVTKFVAVVYRAWITKTVQDGL